MKQSCEWQLMNKVEKKMMSNFYTFYIKKWRKSYWFDYSFLELLSLDVQKKLTILMNGIMNLIDERLEMDEIVVHAVQIYNHENLA